jgi:hypothetical protein
MEFADSAESAHLDSVFERYQAQLDSVGNAIGVEPRIWQDCFSRQFRYASRREKVEGINTKISLVHYALGGGRFLSCHTNTPMYFYYYVRIADTSAVFGGMAAAGYVRGQERSAGTWMKDAVAVDMLPAEEAADWSPFMRRRVSDRRYVCLRLTPRD